MIGWYVHHEGLGHLTRFRSVAAHLRTPVTALSSLGRPPGWTGPWVQLARDDDPPPAADRADPTAHGVLHWVPRHHPGLAARTAQVCEWVRQEAPGLVVVDVSVEVALLTRLAGVPVVVVAMPGSRGDRAHRLAYDLADALLAPWPPGAHTDGWPAAWREKLTTVGAISRFDGRPPPRRREGTGEGGRARRVLLLWGGGGRHTSTGDVDAARAATPGWDWVERGPGSPSPDLWAELADADVVVTHGGQNAVAEVAAARRPAVVVAQPRPFDEQVATAAAVNRSAAAVGLAAWPRDPGRWPAILDRAVRLGGSGWERWSTGTGARDAAGLVDELAARFAAAASTVPRATAGTAPGAAAAS